MGGGRLSPIIYKLYKWVTEIKIRVYCKFSHKIFLGDRDFSNCSFYDCIWPEIDDSNYISNIVSIHDSLDDLVSRSMGEFPWFHDQKLLVRQSYLFLWLPYFIRFSINHLRKRFFIWSCVWIWLPCTSCRPRKVQNLILCFTLDMKNWKISNVRTRIRKLSQQMCKVSEFNFTLLPSAEIYSLEQPRHHGSLFVALSIFSTYLISSIPERPKKFSSNSQ